MTTLALYIAIMGLLAFRLGTIPSPGDDGLIKCVCPGLAGCGAATFLGVIAAQALS